VWFFGSSLVGLLVLAKYPVKHFFSYVPLAFMGTAMGFITSHYMHDNTYLCGNIQHHTNFKDETGENGSGVNSVPHGVFNTLLLAQFLVLALMKNIIAKDKRLNFVDFAKVYLPLQGERASVEEDENTSHY